MHKMVFNLYIRMIIAIFNKFCSSITSKESMQKKICHEHTTQPQKRMHILSGPKEVQIFKRSNVEYCLKTYAGVSRKVQLSRRPENHLRWKLDQALAKTPIPDFVKWKASPVQCQRRVETMKARTRLKPWIEKSIEGRHQANLIVTLISTNTFSVLHYNAYYISIRK